MTLVERSLLYSAVSEVMQFTTFRRMRFQPLFCKTSLIMFQVITAPLELNGPITFHWSGRVVHAVFKVSVSFICANFIYLTALKDFKFLDMPPPQSTGAATSIIDVFLNQFMREVIKCTHLHFTWNAEHHTTFTPSLLVGLSYF
jgi:hypothetical protein